MRKIKYKGTSCLLGRFGRVATGDIIELNEFEANSVAANPEFIAVREPEDPSFPRDADLPKGGLFDISELPWGSTDIYRAVARLKRRQVMAALNGMEAAGFPVPQTDRMQIEDMKDKLLELGRKAGWI